MAIDTTRQLIDQISNATQVGENTAARVGGAMEAIVDDLEEGLSNAQTTYSQCTSSASAASKTVQKTGYKLTEGNLVFVRFTNPTASWF